MILVAGAVVAVVVMRLPVGQPELAATPPTASPISSSSQGAAGATAIAKAATPDTVIDNIIQSATAEQTVAAQDDEVGAITTSDSSLNAFDGAYNENEF